MSRGDQEIREGLLTELARELRQFTGLGASYFRAASARSGMNVTDMQVLDILANGEPLTAGQLADLTGLTTGAITGMINRLEEGGFVLRERDPNDGRRVIVRLAPGKEDSQALSPLFASIGAGWKELAAQYDDEQLSMLLGFLKQSNELTRREIIRLREAPADDEENVAPELGGILSGRLIIPNGVAKITLHADRNISQLYQARFEGTPPDVKTKEGVVTIRYPRRLWMLGMGEGVADVTLNAAIPWAITIRGGVSGITADLGNLTLTGLEVKGGMSMIHLTLPEPTGVVPIQISGAASDIQVRRPLGVAAKVHLQGWVSTFIFDEQMFGNVGNDARLQSANFQASMPYYDIEVNSSASMVTITTAE